MKFRSASAAIWLIASVIPVRPAFGDALLSLNPNQSEPGASVDMCAVLSGNTENSGLGLNLHFDDRCARPMLAASGNPSCTVNPATGKSILTSLLDKHSRILLMALSDQSLIPNGPLFCCTFNVNTDVAPGTTCGFAFSGVSGTTKDGVKKSRITAQGSSLSIRGGDGQAQQGDAAPFAPPAAGGGSLTIPGGNERSSNPAPRATAAAKPLTPTHGNRAYAAPPRTPGEGEGDAWSDMPAVMDTPPVEHGQRADDPWWTPTAAISPQATGTAVTPTQPASTATSRASIPATPTAGTPTAGTPTAGTATPGTPTAVVPLQK